MKLIILAGGGGTRLFPLSRTDVSMGTVLIDNQLILEYNGFG